MERKYPTNEQHNFSVDHRLFSDTTSQLPGVDTSQRTFNHVLVTSHDHERAFTRTTRPGHVEQGATVTVPRSAVESLVTLLHTSFRALWYPRHAVHVADGVSVSFMDDRVRLSFGDLRISKGSPAAGTSRGTLLEINIRQQNAVPQNDETNNSALVQDLLRKLIPGLDIDLSDAKSTSGRTQIMAESEDDSKSHVPDYELANMYTELLRGVR